MHLSDTGGCIAPPNEVAVLALNGTTLANITSFSSVPGTLSFPLPAVDFEATNPSWAIQDSPRFVPAAGGVVPPTTPVPAALVNTSGYVILHAATHNAR
jgi:hypothetical protein